jgi:quaternary ammonium compound-resistance protein SugE
VGWIYLVGAGLFEIGFTTAMRYMGWPVRWGPLLAFLACATASFSLLIKSLETIPLGTAYAVWTGIGAAGTLAVGLAVYGEPATTARLVLLVILIAAIVGLKLVD